MLPECRATDVRYDARRGTLTVRFPVPRDFRPGERKVAATLLLSHDARPVGVDLAPESEDRLVVMIGTHEQVAKTLDATATVAREGDEGTATISEIPTLSRE